MECPSPAHITSACTPFVSQTLSSLTCTTASHTKLSYSCSRSFILIAHAGIRCMQPSTFQILHVEMQVRRAYVAAVQVKKRKGVGGMQCKQKGCEQHNNSSNTKTTLCPIIKLLQVMLLQVNKHNHGHHSMNSMLLCDNWWLSEQNKMLLWWQYSNQTAGKHTANHTNNKKKSFAVCTTTLWQ